MRYHPLCKIYGQLEFNKQNAPGRAGDLGGSAF